MKRLILAALLLTSCAKNTPVRPPTVSGDGWAFAKNYDGSITVIADDKQALEEAMKSMGCGPCSIQNLGQAYTIERIGK